jgi:hypothetical protein
MLKWKDCHSDAARVRYLKVACSVVIVHRGKFWVQTAWEGQPARCCMLGWLGGKFGSAEDDGSRDLQIAAYCAEGLILERLLLNGVIADSKCDYLGSALDAAAYY